MGSIVEFEVFRDYLKVAVDDPRIDDVQRLLDAVNAEVRRLARRDFEGDEGGSYDEVYRLATDMPYLSPGESFGESSDGTYSGSYLGLRAGLREFVLKHVPVASITSIARVQFDGTEYPPYPATAWRLEDAARGRIRLLDDPEYVHVIWRTTGEIPAGIPQAVLDWGKARWDEKDRFGVAEQSIGSWSEKYAGGRSATSGTIAGLPPHSVALALMGTYHATGGGRI